jgi:hypothetical protein
MEYVRKLNASSALTKPNGLELPKNVPEVTHEEVSAACHRSSRARRLHDRLAAREEAGKPLSSTEVTKLVQTATGPDGKPDGDQAVVIAAHARTHPGLFGGAHNALVKFLERVLWRALMYDLHQFMADLKEETAQAQREIDRKRDIDKDRLVYETRKATLLRMERARGEQPHVEVNPQLSAESQTRLLRERMRRP